MKKKVKAFDQHLYHDIEDQDEGLRYKEAAMPLIGAVVLYFNGLEKDIDSALCQMFTDRTDSVGQIVLHKMNYSTKVELFKRFNDDLFQCVEWKIENYQELISNLKECGRLRNLVVHADWENTDNDGYTYVKLKISEKGMEQEYLQFSEESLIEIVDLVLKTRWELEVFWENRNEKLFQGT